MVELSIAAVLCAGMAWDFGRRWVAREHDAVRIATKAKERSHDAFAKAKVNSRCLDEHAIGLAKFAEFEARQKATADKVRMMAEDKAPRKQEPYRSIAGASRRG